MMGEAAAAKAAKETAEEKAKRKTCEELFEEESLECKTCDLIENTRPELNELVAACRNCCHGAIARYTSASLEIDERALEWMDEIKTFIDNHADAFGVKVQYVARKRATLRLVSANGPDEVISVSAWKADVLRDFLRVKLVDRAQKQE